MKYNPLEARCVFIDGPVAVYVSEAPEQVILDAYANLKGVVGVAAAQFNGKATSASEAPSPQTSKDSYLYGICTEDSCQLCQTPGAFRRPGQRHSGLVIGAQE